MEEVETKQENYNSGHKEGKKNVKRTKGGKYQTFDEKVFKQTKEIAE